MAASLVSWPWTEEQLDIKERNSALECLPDDEVMALANAVVWVVQGRIVSVRPWRKAEVEQDS